MRIDELAQAFRKRAVGTSLRYRLGPAASEVALARLAQRIEADVPDIVAAFYRCHDGLDVQEPALEMYSVERLVLRDPGLVPFCVFDHTHELAYDVAARNQAGQWDIVAVPSRVVLTRTLPSFWSNKLFAWIDKRRPVWMPGTSVHA